jgi:hypothetical protein
VESKVNPFLALLISFGLAFIIYLFAHFTVVLWSKRGRKFNDLMIKIDFNSRTGEPIPPDCYVNDYRGKKRTIHEEIAIDAYLDFCLQWIKMVKYVENVDKKI